MLIIICRQMNAIQDVKAKKVELPLLFLPNSELNEREVES